MQVRVKACNMPLKGSLREAPGIVHTLQTLMMLFPANRSLAVPLFSQGTGSSCFKGSNQLILIPLSCSWVFFLSQPVYSFVNTFFSSLTFTVFIPTGNERNFINAQCRITINPVLRKRNCNVLFGTVTFLRLKM